LNFSAFLFSFCFEELEWNLTIPYRPSSNVEILLKPFLEYLLSSSEELPALQDMSNSDKGALLD